MFSDFPPIQVSQQMALADLAWAMDRGFQEAEAHPSLDLTGAR